ncbi:hypothetical protein LSM04_009768 [Trypanosoma melophagium]|uniref:uncharacterized protein n=1 Tax=Trypanosoma melophagium TaxID=715481 RepID=UPI00351A0E6D|nr:hypothetical protein LSM04_009768 [Trypanosoma melophagium]
MRHFNPRLRSTFSRIAERLRQMQIEYELWCDKKDDERISNTFAASSGNNEKMVNSVACDTSNKRRIRCNPDACPRSVLLIPASGIAGMCRRQKRHPITADVIMFDLTNCNVHGGEARESILQFLESNESQAIAKTSHDNTDEKEKEKEGVRYVVRVNSPELDPVNGILDMEMVALLGKRIEGVALPAVSRNTHAVVEEYIHPNHRLWAFFDTPRSVVQAAEICSQGCYHYAVMDTQEMTRNLHLTHMMTMMPGEDKKDNSNNNNKSDNNNNNNNNNGSNGDNTMELDLLRYLPLAHSSCQVILSARAHGMFVLDGPFRDTADTSGFRRNLCYSRVLGFDGKLALRPAQITACHETFTPTREEAERARELQEELNRKRNSGVVLGQREMMQWRHAMCVLQRYNEAELESKES